MCQRFQIAFFYSPKTVKWLEKVFKTLIPGSVLVNRNRKGWSILKDEVINQRAAGHRLSWVSICYWFCVRALWWSQSVEFVHSVQHLLWIGFFWVVNKCQSTYPDIILSFVLVKKKKPKATKSSKPAVGQKWQRGKEKHFGKYCQFWDIGSQRHLTKNAMLNLSLKYPCFKCFLKINRGLPI